MFSSCAIVCCPLNKDHIAPPTPTPPRLSTCMHFCISAASNISVCDTESHLDLQRLQSCKQTLGHALAPCAKIELRPQGPLHRRGCLCTAASSSQSTGITGPVMRCHAHRCIRDDAGSAGRLYSSSKSCISDHDAHCLTVRDNRCWRATSPCCMLLKVRCCDPLAHLYCQYQSFEVHVELGVPQPMLSVGRMPEVIASSCLIEGSWQPSCSCSRCCYI